MLIPVDVAARQSPQATTRLDVAPAEQHPPSILDQGNDDDLGVAEEDPVAFRTGPQVLLRHQPRLGLRSAVGAVGDHRRSEERRVGKECRTRWLTYQEKKKVNRSTEQ